MDEARARAGDGAPHLTTVWAETQTAGRGRQGRSWQSQAGYGLYFTAIVRINLEPERYGLIPLLAGAILCSSVRDLTGVQASLKWPNDLLAADGRKLAGILVEHDVKSSAFLIGIGLNVLPFAAADLNTGFATLRELDPQACAPTVLARVALPLVQALKRFEREGFAAFAQAFAARDLLYGREVRTTHTDVPQGVARGVSAQGALLVETKGRLVTVSSGEVSVRLDRPAAA